MSLPAHEELIREFAEKHLTGEENNDYHIRLKLDHTMRVLDNARAIIEAEKITGRTGELAVMAALYHDIGRFPQFARYRTFRDAESVSHGRMGVLVLRGLDLPSGFSPAEWRLIRAAVGLHNAKDVNPRLRPPLATMVNVTRDADKLDIFTVILDYMEQPHTPGRAVLFRLKTDPTRCTPAVLNAVLSAGSCDYSLLRYEKDFLLLMTGWIFSLTYATSGRLLLERGLVARTFALLPEIPESEILKAKVLDHLNARGSVSS